MLQWVLNYFSGLPCLPPGDLPHPGIGPESPLTPALAGGFFTTSTTWEAPEKPLAQSKYSRKLSLFSFFLECRVYLPRILAPCSLVSSMPDPVDDELVVGRVHPFTTSVVTSHPQDNVAIAGLAQRRAKELHLELSSDVATRDRR